MFKSTDSSNGSSILPNVFEEESACASICPNLTYQQRIYGFVGCCALGWILSVLGTLVLIGGTTTTNIRTFIILYILGNVSSPSKNILTLLSCF